MEDPFGNRKPILHFGYMFTEKRLLSWKLSITGLSKSHSFNEAKPTPTVERKGVSVLVFQMP